MDSTGQFTRREALTKLAMAGAGIAGAGLAVDELVAEAVAAAGPKHGSMADIEHVVILMQENRSFDHYFGMYPGVRGFGDARNRQSFYQQGSDGSMLHPWHIESDCIADVTHDWQPQHLSWNGGRMNGFYAAHQRFDAPVNGVSPAAETLGYYDRADLPFYYSLADQFTICDGYHASVIGPTDPNRLMSMTATIDPAGTHGGPRVYTPLAINLRYGFFSWETMPERLSKHGVSWKVYTGGNGGFYDNVLTYFKQYRTGTKLHARGLAPTYPADFLSDLHDKKLPAVSWLVLGLNESEHPGYSSPHLGELSARQVLKDLVAHPDVWAKTALFITWDENGGMFDHVPPPTAPPGTPGEYLTVANLPIEANGIRGPIGLGIRVPMLVVSPFSRGGLVCSNVFDHTSTLRFLETRFGVKVPNLSKWRRHVTGDLTSAFNFAARPNRARPRLVSGGIATCAAFPSVQPGNQPFPKQPKGKRRKPSGIV